MQQITIKFSEKVETMIAYTGPVSGDGRAEGLYDPGIDVEQIVPRHPGLPRHPRGDDDEIGPAEGIPELVLAEEAGDLGAGADVADIRGDARGGGDIVEGETGDKGVEFHKHRQRLPNPAGGPRIATLRSGRRTSSRKRRIGDGMSVHFLLGLGLGF